MKASDPHPVKHAAWWRTKSQIHALERSSADPVLPLQPGLAERRSHDYVRHGTSTLFAALEISTGKVTAALKQRHRHLAFLAFLKQHARTYPGQHSHTVRRCAGRHNGVCVFFDRAGCASMSRAASA
jgi:hypothetical protein